MFHSGTFLQVYKVNVLLQRFWELESSGIKEGRVFRPEDKCAFDMAEESITYTQGHYQVAIPWKGNADCLPDNYEMAKKRLCNLERRLVKCCKTAEEYDSVILAHLEKGYITRLQSSTTNCDVKKWYLPHFPVIRQDQSSTKVRIVVDASAKCEGLALNDVIYQGPKLQNELFNVLLHFRQYPVALACDIAEMYLRIKMNSKDRSFHRFLWRHMNCEQKPFEYEFNWLVFGVNSTLFLVQFVSQYHAKLYQQSYPR